MCEKCKVNYSFKYIEHTVMNCCCFRPTNWFVWYYLEMKARSADYRLYKQSKKDLSQVDSCDWITHSCLITKIERQTPALLSFRTLLCLVERNSNQANSKCKHEIGMCCLSAYILTIIVTILLYACNCFLYCHSNKIGSWAPISSLRQQMNCNWYSYL